MPHEERRAQRVVSGSSMIPDERRRVPGVRTCEDGDARREEEGGGACFLSPALVLKLSTRAKQRKVNRSPQTATD